MKKYKYKVIFKNQREIEVYCNGFTQAIILAMAEAINKGYDCGILYISDEKLTCIKNITVPNYEFSK